VLLLLLLLLLLLMMMMMPFSGVLPRLFTCAQELIFVQRRMRCGLFTANACRRSIRTGLR
jgi:hypothetical protein